MGHRPRDLRGELSCSSFFCFLVSPSKFPMLKSTEYIQLHVCVCMCAVWHYSWRDMKKNCLFIPDMELATDQRKNTAEVRLSAIMSSIAIPYRRMSERLLTGAGRSQRWLHHQKPTLVWKSWKHKSWRPGAHWIICRQLNRSGTAICRPFSWSLPLSGSSPCLRVSLSSFCCLCKLGEGGV